MTYFYQQNTAKVIGCYSKRRLQRDCYFVSFLSCSPAHSLWEKVGCRVWAPPWRFTSVQSLSHVRLFVTQWIAARQTSLFITNSWRLPKLMSIELVMPSSHLILCRSFLLLPLIPPSIRVFSSESALLVRWPEYWSFSFSISPSNEHPVLSLVGCSPWGH